MSTQLTGLAGDVASFYNISQDEAYTKLKSVFTGETESLKDLGVVMTQTALDSYAMANGFGKTTAQMSEAEKVALRYSFVQNQLSNAAGDFARTSDSWANQTRILALQFDSLRASIGQGLINLFQPIIVQVNALLKKIVGLSSAFVKLTELLTGKKSSDNGVADTADMAAKADDNMSGAAKSAYALTKNTKAAGKAAKKAAKEMFGLASWDERVTIPHLNQITRMRHQRQQQDRPEEVHQRHLLDLHWMTQLKVPENYPLHLMRCGKNLMN